MCERQLPRHRLWIGGDRWGESIFPTFDLDVPMPKGTAVPPEVMLVRVGVSDGAGSPGARSAGEVGTRIALTPYRHLPGV